MYHLAQVNIARMKAPLEDPIMADFVNNLDRINALAEGSPGFIWRLKGEEENATAIRVFEDDRLLINVSVWEDLESLISFTYRSPHVEIYKRRNEWFGKLEGTHMALWYIEKGHIPDPQEAKDMLFHIDNNGESPKAFTFKNRYSPKDFLNSKL